MFNISAYKSYELAMKVPYFSLTLNANNTGPLRPDNVEIFSKKFTLTKFTTIKFYLNYNN